MMDVCSIRKNCRVEEGNKIHAFWMTRFNTFSKQQFVLSEVFEIFKTPYLEDICQILVSLFEQECIYEEKKVLYKMKHCSTMNVSYEFVKKHAVDAQEGHYKKILEKHKTIKEMVCSLYGKKMWFAYYFILEDDYPSQEVCIPYDQYGTYILNKKHIVDE